MVHSPADSQAEGGRSLSIKKYLLRDNVRKRPGRRRFVRAYVFHPRAWQGKRTIFERSLTVVYHIRPTSQADACSGTMSCERSPVSELRPASLPDERRKASKQRDLTTSSVTSCRERSMGKLTDRTDVSRCSGPASRASSSRPSSQSISDLSSTLRSSLTFPGQR